MYIIKDTKIHPDYEDELLYVVSLTIYYFQVGHKEDSIKYASIENIFDALAFAKDLNNYVGDENRFLIEKVSN